MSDITTTKQIFPRSRAGFFFIFRLRPNFFVGFIPGGFTTYALGSNSEYYENMTIERISEDDYLVMQRLGIPEIQVAM